jgi:hypothetical protein
MRRLLLITTMVLSLAGSALAAENVTASQPAASKKPQSPARSCRQDRPEPPLISKETFSCP